MLGGEVAVLLLILLLGSPAAAQNNPIPAPTLVPAPGDAIDFEIAAQSILAAENPDALLAEGVTWGMIRLRSRDFAFPDEAATSFGARIDRLHDAGFKVLLRVESAQPPVADFDALLNFVARLAALKPDAIQVEDKLNDGRIRPELYVGLMRQAYVSIKRANAETLVVGGSLDESIAADSADCVDGACSADAYRAALAAANLGRFADCIGVGYDASAPLAALNLAQTFNPYAEAFPDKPLCLTLDGAADPLPFIRAARTNGRVRLLILEGAS